MEEVIIKEKQITMKFVIIGNVQYKFHEIINLIKDLKSGSKVKIHNAHLTNFFIKNKIIKKKKYFFKSVYVKGKNFEEFVKKLI
jgi:hypothetical protein